jgi:hypothetical protein
MNWVSLVLTAIKLIGALVDFLRERQIISETEQRMLAAALQEQAKTLEAANEARDAQRRSNAGVPRADSLPNDGFRRD